MANRGRYVIDKEKIIKLALDQGMSVNKLCDEAGLSTAVIHINKTHYPSSIKAIADVLGVSVSEIVKE